MSINSVAQALASFGETSAARITANSSPPSRAARLAPRTAVVRPLGDLLQQAVARRMPEGIVDVLEQVEIDVEHADPLSAGLVERLLQALLEIFAVRQVGEPVVVRHVGDARLGLAPFGDVDHRDQIAVTVVEGDAAAEGEHLDLAAVGTQVPPVARGMIGVADTIERFGVAVPLVLRPDLVQLHVQEGGTAVAVMLDRGIVDAEELLGLGVEHPHRHRVVVEQQPERGVAPLQRGDVGDRQREHVGEGGGAEPEMPAIVLDLELFAAAAADGLEQEFHDVERSQQGVALADPAPQQAGTRDLQQRGGALVVMHDLEIERLAAGIAQRRQRDHRVVGRGENRIQQIVLRAALVDIGADQRRAPARGGRQRQHIVGPDHAVAHAMRARLMRPSVRKRNRRRLRQRRGAIGRELGDGDVPALLAEPFLHVASAARQLERTVVLQQCDMVGEPAEAAEHHVLVARQPFARLQRGAPFALKHRDVVKHFGGRFSRHLLRGTHRSPQRTFRAHPMQVHLTACKERAGAGSIRRL
ncbi:hypothetical protein ACVJMY_006806 [Bradyrhizobium diazoefficiens]